MFRRVQVLFLLSVLLAAGAAPACVRDTPAAPTTATPTPGACPSTAGTTCFGTSQWTESVAGDYPVIISVPHGGQVTPASIPDRTSGTTVTDTNTIELGRALALAIAMRTGRQPHLVISHLRRTKLDANREVVEATGGNALAQTAWTEYHAFIEQAATRVVSASGRGLYVDLHGHGHAIQRLELGYLLAASSLNLSDAQLNGGAFASQSSLRLALPHTNLTFADLLRGPQSLGGLLGSAQPAVPSPAMPSPGSDPYFDGGYSTERHTARLPGVQIETNFSGVRDSGATRAAAADRMAAAIVSFLQQHLQL
jgi:hypothetical protein